MNTLVKSLIATAVYCSISTVSAQTSNSSNSKTSGNFTNVVIGEGCASTCVDGVCEKICKGENVSSTSSVRSVSSAGEKAKTYGFKDFNNLEITGFDANIEYAEEFSVSAESNTNDLQALNVDLDVSVEGVTTLKVSVSGGGSLGGVMKITTPELQSLSVSGETDVRVSGFDQDALSLSAAENADIKVNDNVFRDLALSATGNADVSLMESKVTKVDVVLDGNSNAELNFTDVDSALSGTVAGNADLEYCGNPERRLSVAEMADTSQVECD